jgi:RNA polymerase sigma factor (TIGR02999 family)
MAPDPARSEVTLVLLELGRPGVDREAAWDRLHALVYDELHDIAARLMRGEQDDHILRPTALVHEAYLRLVDADRIRHKSRAYFFGAAARAMRQVLVDNARARGAMKRGGGWHRVTLEDGLGLSASPDLDILALNEALTKLSLLDQRMGRIVELRTFVGLTVKEIAHILGVSSRTVDADWGLAKKWLSRELN